MARSEMEIARRDYDRRQSSLAETVERRLRDAALDLLAGIVARGAEQGLTHRLGRLDPELEHVERVMKDVGEVGSARWRDRQPRGYVLEHTQDGAEDRGRVDQNDTA